jgi:DNA-binding cell septation regulator SpoVG
MSLEIEIRKVVPYPPGEGAGVASVTMQYGALIFYGAIYAKDGRRWLGMPGRKTREERWFEMVRVVDPYLRKKAEDDALAIYDNLLEVGGA